MTQSRFTATTFIPNRKILYVDDEPNLLASFNSLMRREGVETIVLQDSQQVETILLAQGPFAAVFSDQRMPVVDGVGVLETVRRIHPDTIRILITGFAEHADTIRAINVGGISHFIAKPWKDDELRNLVQESVNRFNLVHENAFLLQELKRANGDLHEIIEGTVSGTVHILSDMLTYLNPSASSQIDRVRKLGLTFLEMYPELDARERWEVERSLDLFNLGVAVLPPSLQATINKSGLAGVAASALARNHPALGAELLKDIPRFERVARIILLQNKNFDGTGEPTTVSVSGKDIPFGARLLHILIDLDTSQVLRRQGRAVLENMAQQPGKYDAQLLARMLGEQHLHQKPAAQQEQQLTLHEFQAGMFLLDNIVTQSGQLLLKAGFSLTETTLKSLMQWHKNDPIAGTFRVKLNN